MRFRANIENVTMFYRIAQTLERLHKRCIVKLTENEVRFICNSEVNEGGIQVWSQIQVPALFTEYRIQSNANNEITLTLSSEALMATLRSASSPSGSGTSFALDADVVVRLAKKNDQAVLSFEITGTTRMGRRVRVAHDVRIDVMRPQDVSKLREPMCFEPEVHIVLPSLAKLRTVVERMRPLSADVVTIRANGSGCFQLCAETNNARVEVSWNGLSNPAMIHDGSTQEPRASNASSEEDPEERNPEQMYSVAISLKSLQKFLSGHIVTPTTIACICQGHCIILYVHIGEGRDAGDSLLKFVQEYPRSV